MRKIIFKLLMPACLLFISSLTQAQSHPGSGNYIVSGYFFAPANGGYFSLNKTLTKLGPNKYQVDFGTLGGLAYQFTFELDATNRLVNWRPVGSMPAVSGFMTEDNPGGEGFSPISPGQAGFVSSVYNNTYDAANTTFYMHYGYNGSISTGTQNDYSRQVYEKWEYDTVRIFSFDPTGAAAGTKITIKGRKFTGATSVSFGGAPAASFKVLSDTVIKAITGDGAPGVVKVITPQGTATKAGFKFCTTFLTPSVMIRDSAPSFLCPGITVKFKAMAAHAGDNIIYQWIKNKKKVGTNSNVYIDSFLKDNDSVWVLLASHSQCVLDTIVKSNVIMLTVHPRVVPKITVEASNLFLICKGTDVKFTAIAINGGTPPVYTWRKNDLEVGKNSRMYDDSTLETGDWITCRVINTKACNLDDSAVSKPLTFTVQDGVPVAPASIKGHDTVTAGQTGIIFSITGTPLTLYEWRVSQGVTITEGQGTHSIKVTWGDKGGTVAVRGINACGASAYTYKKVTVSPGFNNTGDGGNGTALTALLYPNPAINAATLQVSGYRGKVVVTFTDMAGKIITSKILLQEDKLTGRQQYQLPVSNLSAGLYIVTVKDDVSVKSFKLVKTN